jgi:hypothetical protein
MNSLDGLGNEPGNIQDLDLVALVKPGEGQLVCYHDLPDH